MSGSSEFMIIPAAAICVMLCYLCYPSGPNTGASSRQYGYLCECFIWPLPHTYEQLAALWNNRRLVCFLGYLRAELCVCECVCGLFQMKLQGKPKTNVSADREWKVTLKNHSASGETTWQTLKQACSTFLTESKKKSWNPVKTLLLGRCLLEPPHDFLPNSIKQTNKKIPLKWPEEDPQGHNTNKPSQKILVVFTSSPDLHLLESSTCLK